MPQLKKTPNVHNHFVRNILKMNQIWNVRSRLAKLLCFDKKQFFFKTFFGSLFKHCPLVWIFCSRESNNTVNKRHLRYFENYLWNVGLINVSDENWWLYILFLITCKYIFIRLFHFKIITYYVSKISEQEIKHIYN